MKMRICIKKGRIEDKGLYRENMNGRREIVPIKEERKTEIIQGNKERNTENCIRKGRKEDEELYQERKKGILRIVSGKEERNTRNCIMKGRKGRRGIVSGKEERNTEN